MGSGGESLIWYIFTELDNFLFFMLYLNCKLLLKDFHIKNVLDVFLCVCVLDLSIQKVPH